MLNQPLRLPFNASLLLQIGLNYSDKTNLVSIDGERGPFKIGYDFQREVRGAAQQSQLTTACCATGCPNRYANH
jgi:hypothetical protein